MTDGAGTRRWAHASLSHEARLRASRLIQLGAGLATKSPVLRRFSGPKESRADAPTCTLPCPVRSRPALRPAARHDGGGADLRHDHRHHRRSQPQRAARGHGHGQERRHLAVAHGRHERGGPLRHRRAGAGRLRAARRAHRLQAARAARSAADDCPGPRRQHHPRGRRTERRSDGGRRHAARQHLQRASSAISSGRKRSIGCRSTAATTRTSRCSSRASSPIRIATAARWSRTGSP